jgi:pimeloyl-ACP methyl ester carboxylesterase
MARAFAHCRQGRYAVFMITHTLKSSDGLDLCIHEMGEGPPVLMLHGFLSHARGNWIEPGVAAALMSLGRKLFLLDWRGHGQSAAPKDARFYPVDVLARDVEEVVAHFALQECDLVGYSLGARIGLRALARGFQPKRAALCGIGDSGVIDIAPRMAYFEDAIRNGAEAKRPRVGAFLHAYMKDNGIDAEVALMVLGTQKNTDIADLATMRMPVLIVCGADDDDNGSAEGLARLLPNARAVRTTGDHFTAPGKDDFNAALIDFLR